MSPRTKQTQSEKQRKIQRQDRQIVAGITFARALIRRIPIQAALTLARVVGWAVYSVSKRGRIANRNLRAAFAGEKTDRQLRLIARKSVQNLAMGIVELLKFPEHDMSYLESHVTIQGAEKFQNYLASGKGIIFLTAHFGNWELLNLAGRLLGFPMSVLVRSQKHPQSDAYLNSIRSHHGTQVIAKGMPIREIIRALRRGTVVGMLSDQDGGAGGVFVDFFGRQSSCPAGVAAFAIRTQTPIFPVFAFRDPGDPSKHHIEVEGPLLADKELPDEENERNLLQAFSSLLEKKIRKSPEQWLWVHRRWKSTPDRYIAVLTDGKPGHEQQSQAALESLREERRAARHPDSCFHASFGRVVYRSDWHRRIYGALGLLTGGRSFTGTTLLRAVLTPESFKEISSLYADVVISCGSSTLPVNIYLKRLNGAKSVYLMKPPSPLIKQLDVVITPKHDKISAKQNIFKTHLAPSPEIFRNGHGAANGNVRGKPEGEWLGCLIGGDTRQLFYDKARFESFLTGLESFAVSRQVRLAITTSRRTPNWADALVERKFSGNERSPIVIIANRANREGVVREILNRSSAIVATGDSVSMVSDAVRTGKPVVVFHPYDVRRMRSKFKDFYSHLERSGLALLADDNLPAALNAVFSLKAAGLNVLDADRESLRAAARRVLA